jgi:hypothetical protein
MQDFFSGFWYHQRYDDNRVSALLQYWTGREAVLYAGMRHMHFIPGEHKCAFYLKRKEILFHIFECHVSVERRKGSSNLYAALSPYRWLETAVSAFEQFPKLFPINELIVVRKSCE